MLFNFEGHVVLSAERTDTGRRVLVEPVEREGACPDCGVLSSRVQGRPSTASTTSCAAEHQSKSWSGSGVWPVWNRSVRGP
ncbi:hypothetical protein JOE41_001194 [Arthrobacter sp. PvP103]|nr:hypothetical protein [Arthrobacter sp. PvP103]